MGTDPADITHLSHLWLLVQRFLDAEVLSVGEGAALLAEIAAVHRALAAGDTGAARGHLTDLARLTGALVEAEALARADGEAVIETADRLLETLDMVNPATDAD